MVALVTTMVLISVSSAAAANKTVGFNKTDYIYIPDRVAIKTGESVTWSNAGSDEPHNVHFEDGQFTRPVTPATSFTTSPRTFSAEGVYRYFCDTHGRDMSGAVYVNATGVLPPDARLRVSPNPAVAGEVVTFDGTASKAGDNPVAKYEWDLNGDGMYEVDTGTTRTTSRTYLAAQELTARLKVTDTSGISEVREMPVSVQAAPPTDPAPTPPSAPAPQPPTATAPVTTPVVTTPAPKPITPSPPRPAKLSITSVASGLPSTRRCLSRRSFRIRLRNPVKAKITSATVKVNGRVVATRKGKRITAPVQLKGLPKGRYTVGITAKLADGRTVTGTRKYRTCAPKRRR